MSILAAAQERSIIEDTDLTRVRPWLRVSAQAGGCSESVRLWGLNGPQCLLLLRCLCTFLTATSSPDGQIPSDGEKRG
jgi:hypothetical protein